MASPAASTRSTLFNVKGTETAARGLSDASFGNLVFESLLMRSADEPFTLYGFIAETVETSSPSSVDRTVDIASPTRPERAQFQARTYPRPGAVAEAVPASRHARSAVATAVGMSSR